MSALLLALLASFPLRIAIMGDRSGSPDDDEFRIAVDAIVNMSPDIVLSVGDYVEGNGDVETAVADWENILPTLRRLTDSFPFIFVPGNNDIWNSETARYWEDYTGTTPSRVEEVMGVKFVVWDSSIPDSLGERQLQQIDSLTAGMSGDEPWIFVTHKPFWFMSYQDSASTARFMDIMERRHPLAVVGGHIHRFAAQRIHGILYISAGPSGSTVWEPDPDRGDFTQLGWMTLWQDSVHLSVIDARGVYPESLNTGEEMDLDYRYRHSFLHPRPLEPGLESAILELEPVETVPRDVAIDIDSGNWDLDPVHIELQDMQAPQQFVFTQNPSGSPYPSPTISVSLNYGPRGKALSFRQSWQVLRTVNAFMSDVELDGMEGSGEYRSEPQTDFADFSGQPSAIPSTRFDTATDGEKLFICMRMDSIAQGTGDYAGFILGGRDGSFLWLRLYSDGSVNGKMITAHVDIEEWEEGLLTSAVATEEGWSAEVAVDLSLLEIRDNMVRAHVYRSAGDAFGTWVYPIEFDANTMGRIWIQPEN